MSRRTARSVGRKNEYRMVRRNPYLDGTAAPAYNDGYNQEEEELARRKRKALKRAREEKARLTRLNVAVLTLIFGMMCVLAAGFVHYVSLQYRITNSVEEIASLQSSLTALKQQNDENLNRINSSINLDDIKYTAIAELGMTYASEDQIITYSNNAEDYVHQVKEIGK